MGVHPWILDGAFVDLHPLDPLAHDAPALQHAQGPADPREPHAGRADDGGREVDGLPDLGHAVAADVQDDGPVGARRTPRARASPGRGRAGSSAPPPCRTTVPSPPAPRGTTPTQPSAPGTHPKGTDGGTTVAGRQARRRRLDEHHVIRRDADVVLPGRPLQLHRLCRAQRAGGIPLADAQEDALAVIDRHRRRSLPSSTPNRTRPPSAASRCTCDAIGTVSPPANSSGSRNREYCEGIPASGRARTDPACQNTPASASDSWRRYQTALPSLNSTACRAPAALPPPPPPSPPSPSTATASHRHRRQPARTAPTPRATPAPLGTGFPAGRAAASPTSEGRAPRWPRSPRHRSPDRPADTATIRPTRSSRETPMRPINLPAYGKVEACPRSRRTSPSAA